MRQAVMRILELLQRFRNRFRPRPIDKWFAVRFDDDRIYASSRPPGGGALGFEIRWAEVTKIVFVAEDLYRSDWICVFLRDRSESHDIPIEARGGLHLWEEILRRGLFDRELAGEANRSLGGRFEWPPAETSPAA